MLVVLLESFQKIYRKNIYYLLIHLTYSVYYFYNNQLNLAIFNRPSTFSQPYVIYADIYIDTVFPVPAI